MSEDDKAQRDWERDKPRSSWKDKHGREELLVHPHLLIGAAPAPRKTGRTSEQ